LLTIVTNVDTIGELKIDSSLHGLMAKRLKSGRVYFSPVGAICIHLHQLEWARKTTSVCCKNSFVAMLHDVIGA
jgi:hypothetical protein